MTWLYSILFASLFVASDSQPTAHLTEQANFIPQTRVSTVLDESEKFEQTYPLSSNGRVSVSNINGSITVEAWDKNEVRLEATKVADTKETLAEMELDISSANDRFSVEVNYSKSGHGNYGKWGKKRMEVVFRLMVPKTAVLDEIESVNGSVIVSNFTNNTKVSAVNGDITATNLRGNVNLSTVTGFINCDFERLEGSSKVSLSTVNGQVNLTLPSDINAIVKADTLNGNIKNDFGLRVKKGEYVGRDLYGRIGSGEAQIKLDSVNGPLAINRKNDGKSVNSVTNLLSEKESESDDNESMTRNTNRSIDQSVRVSQRQAEASMRDAQRELEKIKPELNKIKLKDLENLKTEIDTKAFEDSIRQVAKIRAETMANMREAMWTRGIPAVVKQTKSFPVRGVPRVNIDAKKCDVIVRGWDNPEVKYTFTEIGRDRDSSNAAISDSASESEVKIKVTGDNTDGVKNDWSANAAYRLEIFVPRKSTIKVVTDGEIRVSGITGEIDVTGSDEAIDFRDIEGELKITAENARIRVVGFKGDLISETVDGPVFLEGEFKSIKSTSIDGQITLTLPSTANAVVSSNGNIHSERTDGVREKDGKLRFGAGSSSFEFNVVDGKILIRDSLSVESKY